MENNKEIAKKENILSAIMAAITFIPVVGSAINEVLFDRRSRIKQERINSLVNELKTSFEKLEEEKINKEFLYSEEFGDVLESTFKKASEFGNQQRIKRFKNIIVNQIRIKEDSSIIETYLNLITTLNEKQILLLDKYQKEKKYLEILYKRIKEEEKREPRLITSTNKEVTLENADVYEIRNFYNEFKNSTYKYAGINENDDIPFFIQDLISKSLIIDLSSSMGIDEINELIHTTNYAERFLKFIVEYE